MEKEPYADLVTIMTKSIKSKIRTVPHWPKEGIMFKDITTLLKDAQGFKETIDLLHKRYKNKKIDKVIGIESRGFILGAALAYKLNVGFIPIRKPGKLPGETISESYQLEYGEDKLEIHSDAIDSNNNVLLVDDLLATGGSAQAACKIIEKLSGKIVGIVFLIELSFLNGREKLKKYDIHTLINYQSE